jgi:hypothetical protein
MATKTVTPTFIFSGFSSATRRSITPSASSFWMRRQQGEGDSPTRSATSATGRSARSCSTERILRSMSSMQNYLSISSYVEKFTLF